MKGNVGFDHPWVLGAFAVFIPFLIMDLLRRGDIRRVAVYLASSFPPPEGPVPGDTSSGAENKFFRKFRLRCWGSRVCFCLFLASGIIALAGPHWGSRTVAVYRRGLDLVLALDLSRSMEVRDVSEYSLPFVSPGDAPVSRLERSFALAADIISRTPGIRTGVAIGRGRGILALPLTYDTGGLLSLLEGLRGAVMTGTGTNLEALIDAAAGAFQDAFPGRRGIVLFSDGEALTGSLAAALARAREAGIGVSVLGLGTDTGEAVPLKGPDGEAGVLRDDGGRAVISFRRSESLRDAALRTGGIYVDGNRDDAAVILAEYLNALSSGLGPAASRREPGARWHIFVIAGMAFWGLSRLLGLTWRRGGGGKRNV